MARHSPTLRRRRLSAELRRLREARKMTAAQADKELEWTEGKLSRMERGDWARPNLRDIKDLLDVYNVTDETHREQLLTLARQGRERGWWHPYRDMLSATYSTYIGLEAEAAAVHTFQLAVVPGLLQTPEYARELITRGPGEISEEQIDRYVEIRMARQELLTRGDDPLRLWAVIDEMALRRQVCGPDVMKAQMRHIRELARLAKVTVQVVPANVGAYPGTLGSFSILQFPHPDDPEAAYVETIGGELFIEHHTEVKSYQVAFQRLTAYALTPPDSLQLIAELAA